ncbi:hypothetical protein HY837_05895 [archaeon]|nr:hypothetical protein [archaeon]
MEINTGRYKINVEELKKGGPGGYESTYLTSEGDAASKKLYSLLDSFSGTLLPVKQRMIRQRNGKGLTDALAKEESVGIASGFKPSGAYHFGHKLASGAVAFFQKNGAQVFMPVADVECDMDSKISKEDYEYWAADNLLDWGANGVNLDAAHVYLQSEEFRVNGLAYLLARSLSFDLSVNTYGFKKLAESFPFLFAGVTQVGDIVLPQHSDFGNAHSFMVSGQDQDGHMKMTVELVKGSFKKGVELPGVQTVPSAFYIPHIRGLVGDKASSSKSKGTLYLGSGPNHEDIEERIKSSLKKFDAALRKSPKDVANCATDMVMYIDAFNEKVESGKDAVEVVRSVLPSALRTHQKKRQEVLNYALARANQAKSEQPNFWKVPKKSVVDEALRNKTKWYDLVVKSADKLNA